MSEQFDSLARKAAAGLRSTMETAELRSTVPGAKTPRRSVVLRPAWMAAALLLLGSAVGVAMMMEPSAPPPTTVPPTTTTTTPPPTTVPVTVPAVVAAPPTSAAVTDDQPPLLVITTPEDGATLVEKTVAFTGVTEPGAVVSSGKYQADVDGEGNWRIVLVLSEGRNVARFTARDSAGNEAQASVTVTYMPPTTTTTTKPDLAEFTAYATFGSCAETPPWDRYYGTGVPGTMVHVQSEYGSKSGEIGEDGGWELEVFFETAPPGVPFAVKVFDDFGRKFTFEFVYTP